jgi:GTPase SAR1 family protein/Ca2+-binding EF-hand superfamily protein
MCLIRVSSLLSLFFHFSRFPFVRQCIKCSAKNLLRVDDVFLKAQQAVLYPFTPPLYDLETGRLTQECKRALTRIFRIFDKDHDGLLSDAELDRFQRETYHVAVFDRDLAAWKKVVTRNAPDAVVLHNGKFTTAGFFAIFDVFISQNRLDVVWQALRKFQYDDDLNLHIPETVRNGLLVPEQHTHETPASSSRNCQNTSSSSKSWKLSSSAKKFLTALFHQFDADQDGKLSRQDLIDIFSILPPPALPPWHPIRVADLFEGCFSIPKASPPVSRNSSPNDSPLQTPKTTTDSTLIVPPATPMAQSLSNSGLSILSASDSLPSVDDGMHPSLTSLTLLEWMGHWHAVAAISPAVARAEVFRLGHVPEDGDNKKRSRKKRKTEQKSREIRVLVAGSPSVGKTALLHALCNDGDTTARHYTPTMRPETSTTVCKLKRSVSGGNTNMKGVTSNNPEDLVVHLVFTDVPAETIERSEDGAPTKDFDLVMLVFDCTQLSSWNYVKKLESSALLTKETPRVFVGTKADLLHSPEPEDGDALPATVVDAAEIHCRELDLESPLLISLHGDEGGTTVSNTLDHIARCALLKEPGIPCLRSRPHEEQKRREAARRRKMMWLGGIVSVGVVVAVGMGVFWAKNTNPKSRSSGFGWFQSWFGSTEKPKTS